MNEVLITSISFIAAILVSIYVAFAGIAYYSSWEQKRLAEKEKIDRIKFGIDQEDVMVPVQGSKAVDYYKHQFVEYSHEYLKKRMADLIGNIMKVIDGALVLISLIYTAALVYLSISKGINSALLIWVMPAIDSNCHVYNQTTSCPIL